MAQASGKDVAAVAASWTDQPGFPLVQMRESCRDGRTQVTLTQRRFALHGALPAQQWKIPVRLARGAQIVTALLDGETAQLELDGCSDEPLVANAGGRGFYRVDYDAAQWQRLAAGFAKLAAADRVGLLSDSFALAQAGQLPMSVYLNLLARLPQAPAEGRAALFAVASAGLNFLDDTLAGTPAQARLRERGRALFAPELARLGWQPRANDDAETLKLRGTLIQQLARFDDAAVVHQARERFDRGGLPASIREGVLMAVGMHADRARFARLNAGLRHAAGEEDRWLYASALAAGRDRAQAEALLATALNGTLAPNIAAALPGLMAEHSPFGELA